MAEKSIICPKCKKFLTKAKSNDGTLHKLKHKDCGAWIWYVPKNDYFEIHKVPERETSSGIRFY